MILIDDNISYCGSTPDSMVFLGKMQQVVAKTLLDNFSKLRSVGSALQLASHELHHQGTLPLATPQRFVRC